MKKFNVKAWMLLGVVGLLYFYSTIKRVGAGYFNSGFWIATNSVLWVMFFGLLTGLVINTLMKKVKR